MSGNEAIARGAWEAGVRVGAGYPGTPSTEILEALSQLPGVDAEWSPNEKVALEVAVGASLAGARSLAAMKHVGVNVAADPLCSVAYMGVSGGLVVVTADDPGMHSSQNEQDNRLFARHARIPLLEPATPDEARAYTDAAFYISETYDTPVLLRTTTRLNHGTGRVRAGPRREVPLRPYRKNDHRGQGPEGGLALGGHHGHGDGRPDAGPIPQFCGGSDSRHGVLLCSTRRRGSGRQYEPVQGREPARTTTATGK